MIPTNNNHSTTNKTTNKTTNNIVTLGPVKKKKRKKNNNKSHKSKIRDVCKKIGFVVAFLVRDLGRQSHVRRTA